MPASLGSGKSLLPGLQTVAFLLYPFMAEKANSLVSSSKCSNPITSSSWPHLNLISYRRTHLQISYWWLVFQYINLGGDTFKSMASYEPISHPPFITKLLDWVYSLFPPLHSNSSDQGHKAKPTLLNPMVDSYSSSYLLYQQHLTQSDHIAFLKYLLDLTSGIPDSLDFFLSFIQDYFLVPPLLRDH